MRVIYERCCGLDVHKKSVVACVITPHGEQTRTFGTMTVDLLDLLAWLQAEGVSHVAMESTGVYWKPVFNLLEDQGMELLVVNARHVKAVPGRKTDVKDAEWLADLLRHGLLRGSFIPKRADRELRELVRYRQSLVEERTRVVLRIQKVLEGANLKLAAVASDVVGVSGRAMLEALIEGESDTALLADLARTRLRSKRPQLEQALQGSLGPHQRFLLRSQLRLLDSLAAEIEALDAEVAERMRPFEAAVDLLDEVPGIGRRSAENILAEIGIDMSRFSSSAQIGAWARLAPGNNESAGKRRKTSIGGGNRWLRSALVEAARAAVRTRQPSFFKARYRRLAARRGDKRALVAVAHSLLTAIYHMLRDGVHFHDLGATHWDEHNRERVVQRAVHRIEQLGYQVRLEATA